MLRMNLDEEKEKYLMYLDSFFEVGNFILLRQGFYFIESVDFFLNIELIKLKL